ncbi:hypothetical protein FGM00_11160 [Aggregatimonas sangjinii]|uniref:Uncharacterized protein n=1 Tax=Aggregatimonas sangjinii TaxID=2583587 RepID=A0A5B7SPM9_9FLAO|nr:hypothetical protein [Aggregatimonas sangjinii]QCX00635.1 hypothetical protein FGM00_11160 [Aggregatimonas sangjinii]
MNFIKSIFLLLVVLACNFSIAQIASEAEGMEQNQSLFTVEESEYIAKWFSDFVSEMNLSQDVALKYKNITETYSRKMDALGMENPPLGKAELIEQFNDLMESLHQEVKSILKDEQYEMYYDTMEKVSWSINQRLKHL